MHKQGTVFKDIFYQLHEHFITFNDLQDLNTGFYQEDLKCYEFYRFICNDTLLSIFFVFI